MGVLRWVRKHRKASASAGVLAAAAVALGVMAFSHEGFTTTDLDLNDGGVWVTNQNRQIVGHLNAQAQELDFGIPASSDRFDVLQDDEWVFLRNEQTGAVSAIDPTSMTLGGSIALPADALVEQRGGTFAVLFGDGRLWALPVAQAGSFNEELDPLAELGEGAAMTVGLDGSLAAASVEEPAVHVWHAAAAGFDPPEVTQRDELASAADIQIAMVGGDVVVLDSDAGTLVLPDRVVEVPAGAALQHDGDESGDVMLADGESLIRQPLGGGEAATASFGAGGPAVAPVQLRGCVYAAWPSTRQFLRDCAGEADDLEQVLERMDDPSVFRVNRGVVVLNQVDDGDSWLVNDQVILVDNWEDLIPPESEQESEEQDESTEESLENVTPPPSQENHPPVAEDDEFGARPGRSSILPVFLNDSDQDGDVLTASVSDDLPGGVRVAPVTNDSQLQIDIPADYAGGPITFEYTASDGRGGSDTANVTVAIRAPDENGAPQQMLRQGFQIEQTATFEYSALQGWVDPDGDDFYLAGAQSASGDDLQFSPAGRIVYTATGATGITDLQVQVTDGQASADAAIQVDVRERDQAKVTANADFIATTAGQPVSFEPLANDYIPGGQVALLATVEPNPGLEVATFDPTTGTVTVMGNQVNSFYLTYIVTAGSQSATGRIRVDIRSTDDEARPVAVRDVALVPRGGEVLVDLLDNDVDPSGGVLVVQSVELGGVPIVGQLVQQRVLRLSDTRGLQRSEAITYTVSNGRASDTGQVVVFPVDPPTQPRAPVTVDDTAVVREGDVVTVPITANDFSPDNAPFEVAPQLVASSLTGPEEGVAFIDGDTLRLFVAEGGPSRVEVTYEVLDEFGQRDAGVATIDVIRRDPERNDPPIAETVTARAIAGKTITIPIPLDGIDPDGDAVELIGNDDAPDTGRIVDVGDGFFTFEAFPTSAGTTRFTYRVRDRWGLEATAAVVVGIAPPAAVNQAPFAEVDRVFVKPDRVVAVAVLDNDSDPDGDALTVLEDGLVLDAGLDAAQVNSERDTVDFTSPAEPGTYSFTYAIQDERGASATGSVLVEVAESAPTIAPTAVDDVVDDQDAVLDEPLVVPVLDNDRDADGSPDTLEIEVVAGPGVVDDEGVKVVPIAESFQVVTYQVTDPDGQVASAFVFVPQISDQLPYVTVQEPIPVLSGERREFALRDYVWADGGAPRITDAASVSATDANDDELVVDTETLQYTSKLGYVGPAALSFTVTDGESANDPEGNVAQLTLPLIVQPSSAVPPTFAGATIQVEQGEPAVAFDLTNVTVDPDPGDLDDMVYRLVGGQASGIDAAVDGQRFVASAGRDTPPGTSASYQVEIEDPAGSKISGTVVVEVVLSKRPLAIAADDRGDGVGGQASSFNVLANDFNPFASESPLTIVSAAVVSGQGQASANGSSVSVTPNADFSGVLTVQYTVQDATGSLQRQVTGTLVVTVKNRPEPPIRPNVLSVGDSKVTLSWSPPNANGAAISGYTVTSSTGSTQACQSTTCEITGLTNDVTYTFTVVATNEIGDSDPSPASAEARPDVRPGPPGAATVTRGDGQLALAWQQPENRGSTINRYVVRISPPAPNGQVVQEIPGGTTSHTWVGLQNGTAYTFQIQAYNNAPEPSEWSPVSQPQTPAGPPLAVAGVQATRDTQIKNEVQVVVRWSAHANNDNGAAIQHFTVTPWKDGAPLASNAVTVAGEHATSTTFSSGSLPSSSGSTYTFVVTATNDAGTSPDSVPSAGVRDATTPEAPTITDSTDGDGFTDIVLQAGSRNGASASEVSYVVYVDGTRRGTVAEAGGRIDGLRNSDRGYAITVRAESQVQGVGYQSAPSNSVQARPFGLPPAPSVAAQAGQEQVTFSWTVNGTNGRPLQYLEWTDLHDGSKHKVTPAANGSQTVTVAAGSNACITAIVVDSENKASPTSQQACATARGVPTFSLRRGPEATSPHNGVTAPNFVVTWSNLTAGDTIQFQCFDAQGTIRDGTPSWRVPSASGTSPDDQYTFCVSRRGAPYTIEFYIDGQTYDASTQ